MLSLLLLSKLLQRSLYCCSRSEVSSVECSDLAFLKILQNTHLGDLCVHFGDEWAFGLMSRKIRIERVKSKFFGPTVAISSFVAEEKTEVPVNHQWWAQYHCTSSIVTCYPPSIIATIFGTLSRRRANSRGGGYTRVYPPILPPEKGDKNAKPRKTQTKNQKPKQSGK